VWGSVFGYGHVGTKEEGAGLVEQCVVACHCNRIMREEGKESVVCFVRCSFISLSYACSIDLFVCLNQALFFLFLFFFLLL
jgi:hypothetical protein